MANEATSRNHLLRPIQTVLHGVEGKDEDVVWGGSNFVTQAVVAITYLLVRVQVQQRICFRPTHGLSSPPTRIVLDGREGPWSLTATFPYPCSETNAPKLPSAQEGKKKAAAVD